MNKPNVDFEKDISRERKRILREEFLSIIELSPQEFAHANIFSSRVLKEREKRPSRSDVESWKKYFHGNVCRGAINTGSSRVQVVNAINAREIFASRSKEILLSWKRLVCESVIKTFFYSLLSFKFQRKFCPSATIIST